MVTALRRSAKLDSKAVPPPVGTGNALSHAIRTSKCRIGVAGHRVTATAASNSNQ